MYEVREKENGQWIKSEFVGLEHQEFRSLDEAMAEAEIYLADLAASYHDGLIEEFDEETERGRIAVFHAETGRFCRKIKKVEYIQGMDSVWPNTEIVGVSKSYI